MLCFCLQTARHWAVRTSTQIAESANRIRMIEILDEVREQFFRQHSIGLPLKRIESIKRSCDAVKA